MIQMSNHVRIVWYDQYFVIVQRWQVGEKVHWIFSLLKGPRPPDAKSDVYRGLRIISFYTRRGEWRTTKFQGLRKWLTKHLGTTLRKIIYPKVKEEVVAIQ